MLELRLKPEAESDLIKIFEYTSASWGVDQAEKYQDDLYQGMLLLTEEENLGKEYPYTSVTYRKLHINRHLKFYRVEGQNCTIIRILHDRMDIENQLGQREFDI